MPTLQAMLKKDETDFFIAIGLYPPDYKGEK